MPVEVYHAYGYAKKPAALVNTRSAGCRSQPAGRRASSAHARKLA